MNKDAMEMEDNPRSFRCEKAIGRVIDNYITAWDRKESDVIRRILRHALKEELPPQLRIKEWK